MGACIRSHQFSDACRIIDESGSVVVLIPQLRWDKYPMPMGVWSPLVRFFRLRVEGSCRGKLTCHDIALGWMPNSPNE
jgi:hypothetical protein